MTIRKQVAVLCVTAFYLYVSTYQATAESPAPESSSSPQTLTDGQINKLKIYAAQAAPNANVDKRATAALGLTKGDEQLFLNQLATKERTGEVRGFYALPNDGGYLLAFAPEHNTRYWYHVDKKFHLLGGILQKLGEGRSITVINAPDAQEGVNAELKVWSHFADTIVPADPKKRDGRDVNPLPSPSPK
jgi:hypothetical protein